MDRESRVRCAGRTQGRLREIWPGIAALAARQRGTVAHAQLLASGVSADQIKRLVARGVLHPVHRGVYAVGHSQLTREGRWMAAVLAGGRGAALSHLTAAFLWRLINPFSSLPEVTVRGRSRRRPGIRLHCGALPADEVTERDGFPVTTVARTLLDLASVLDEFRLERALAQAHFHRYADSPSLPELLERHAGRRGTRRLRRVLGSGRAELGITASPLEDRFLRFLDARGLERPETNAPLQLPDGFVMVDCLWRRQRIALELDGRDAHERKLNFESDRLRDRRLSGRQWRPVRITSEQLNDGPEELDADLRAMGVGAGGASGAWPDGAARSRG